MVNGIYFNYRSMTDVMSGNQYKMSLQKGNQLLQALIKEEKAPGVINFKTLNYKIYPNFRNSKMVEKCTLKIMKCGVSIIK